MSQVEAYDCVAKLTEWVQQQPELKRSWSFTQRGHWASPELSEFLWMELRWYEDDIERHIIRVAELATVPSGAPRAKMLAATVAEALAASERLSQEGAKS